MILVDTSVWVDHFRHRNNNLAEMLERQSVLTHPFVVGELACGDLRERSRMLDLVRLPSAKPAHHPEVLALIEERHLWNKGIGWVDAHLLAASLLSGCGLWTLDKSLGGIAKRLGITAP